MWKNQRDSTVKAVVNGWTLIVHLDGNPGSNQHWWRIGRRQWLVGAGNSDTVAEAKVHLENWAKSHNYVGRGRIEKV